MDVLDALYIVEQEMEEGDRIYFNTFVNVMNQVMKIQVYN